MADGEHRIAWTALEKGARVYSSEGEEVGRVSSVVADDMKDIFSGVAFRPGLLGDERFAPASLVADITEEGVHLTVATSEAEGLSPFEV
jgi:hypothetical protein